jgi:hypothetical protein
LFVIYYPIFCQGSYFADIGTEIDKKKVFDIDSIKYFHLILCIGLPG